MLGSLRLLLAIAVACSHAGFHFRGLNVGVMAVIGFYLISGYVMAGLLRRHYAGQAFNFYFDRAVRLLPQYFSYAVLTLLAFWLVFHPGEGSPSQLYFLGKEPGLSDLLNNLLIVPLNYYMWNGSDRFTLIPTAWSLGTEIQFYLIAPFLLLCIRRLWGMAVISMCVYVLALSGVLNSDWYGYRLLPGVLFFFMLGALLQHFHNENCPKKAFSLMILSILLGLSLAWTLQQFNLLYRPYNQETLFGFFLAMPLLHFLARRKRQIWDDVAGDISYGVFLNHFLIIWVFFPQGIEPESLPLFLTASILTAFLTHLIVEKPFLIWRKKFRQKHSAAQTM